MISIINYDKKYNEEIDFLDDNYWGDNSGDEKVSEIINENDIFKIALDGDKLVGILHFKQIGDLIDCYHVLVQEDYQNHGVATMLMEEAFKDIEKRNVHTLVAHAVEHNGVINAKRLLEKFGFSEIYRVKNYWSSLYPNEYCKQCDSNNCHCGVVVFLKVL